ncbi:hypothetical protein LTR95_011914 [Oleoguttula sp. CCFEE 5521]
MAAEGAQAEPQRNDPEYLAHDLQGSDATSEQFANAVTTLANLSRTSADTRKALADHDVIKRLMDAVAVPILLELPKHQTTAIAILRCLGNACYDDEDSEIDSQVASYIVEFGFEWMHHLPCTKESNGRDATVSIMALRVLNNVTTLSSAVPTRMAADNLDNWLIDTLASSMLPAEDGLVTYACSLLASIYGLDVRSSLITPERLNQLLSLAAQYACDPIHGVMTAERLFVISSSVCNYLNRDAQKQQIVDLGLQDKVWDLFVLVDRLSQAPADARDAQSKRGAILRRNLFEGDGSIWDASMELFKPDPALLKAPQSSDEESEIPTFTQAQLLQFVWLLSDLAAVPSFAPTGLEDPLMQKVTQLLAPPSGSSVHGVSKVSPYRLTAACQILGNVLHNGEWRSAASLVQRDRIHVHLVSDLLETAHDEYRHAGASLLCQLTRSSTAVREELALSPDMAGVCSMLARHPNPQLRADALQLIKALGRASPVTMDMYAPLLQEAVPFDKTHREARTKQGE